MNPYLRKLAADVNTIADHIRNGEGKEARALAEDVCGRIAASLGCDANLPDEYTTEGRVNAVVGELVLAAQAMYQDRQADGLQNIRNALSIDIIDPPAADTRAEKAARAKPERKVTPRKRTTKKTTAKKRTTKKTTAKKRTTKKTTAKKRTTKKTTKGRKKTRRRGNN